MVIGDLFSITVYLASSNSESSDRPKRGEKEKMYLFGRSLPIPDGMDEYRVRTKKRSEYCWFLDLD